ncbi:MAG TPA: Rieske 2Fe-2S domain-containing protein [Stellaceae bacterium]|jgi:phenylpropionate dioxygenase-like ring-hydroxylating dioxygenase large terminal subunit
MNRDDHLLLAETGAGTAMGNFLRRYWMPALLSSELVADGAPVRVELMGENLIAFRGSDGKVGLLGAHCAHRGASLFFAKNADCKLRCWYHGWQYDRDGNCVDQPNEPPQTQFKTQVKQKAYPTIEQNGTVWTYLGPRDKQPPLPELEWLTVPAAQVHVAKRIQHCHWTQGMEGDIDSSHLGFLHGHAISLPVSSAPSAGARVGEGAPEFAVKLMPAGLVQATRRNAEDGQDYWRVGQWFFPGFTTIPARGGDAPLQGHSWTPIDDATSLVFTFTWHPTRPLSDDELNRIEAGTNFHAHLVPGTFLPRANKANGYAATGYENERQPWMRIKYFQDQDICMTESMGRLYDRTQENLGNSDLVVVRTRHRLIEAARDLARGIEPPGMKASDYRLRPTSQLLPKGTASWLEALGAAMDARPGTYRESV